MLLVQVYIIVSDRCVETRKRRVETFKCFGANGVMWGPKLSTSRGNLVVG
jgi:hypothetical protein